MQSRFINQEPKTMKKNKFGDSKITLGYLFMVIFLITKDVEAIDQNIQMKALFEGQNIYGPSVLFDQKNKKYEMWYFGWHDEGQVNDRIYYRSSKSGLDFGASNKYDVVYTGETLENQSPLAKKIGVNHVGDPSVTKIKNEVTGQYQYTMFFTVCLGGCKQKDNQVWSIVSNDGKNWLFPTPLLSSTLGSAEPTGIFDPDPKTGRIWRVVYTDRLDPKKIKMVNVGGNRKVIGNPITLYSLPKEIKGVVSGAELKRIGNKLHLFFNRHVGTGANYKIIIEKVTAPTYTSFQQENSTSTISVIDHGPGSPFCSATTPSVYVTGSDSYNLYFGLARRRNNGMCIPSNHKNMIVWRQKLGVK